MSENDYGKDYFLGDRGRRPTTPLLQKITSSVAEFSERRVSARVRAGVLARLFHEYRGDQTYDKVLDVGSGRFWLRESLKKLGITAYGVDLSREGFILTKSKIKVPPGESLGMVQGNALQLPYPDKSFLLVSCSDVLEHLTNDGDAETCIDELGRVGKRVIFLQVTPTDYAGGLAFAHDKTHHLGKTTEEWDTFFRRWAKKGQWSMSERLWTKDSPKFPPQPPAWIFLRNKSNV